MKTLNSLLNICLMLFSVGLAIEALTVMVGLHMPSPQHIAWCALSGAGAGMFALVRLNV